MSSIIGFAAVNTKIRAMEGRFLKEKDYQALLEKESVPEIVMYLKETAYREAFAGWEEASLHRGQIEALLQQFAVDQLMRLKPYFKGSYAKLFKIILMRYEIEDLKLLIRAIKTDRTYIDQPNLFAYIGRYGDLNFNKLAGCESFRELLENLQGTLWHPVLLPLLQDEQTGNHFQVDMALDLAYVSAFKKHLELLPDKEKARIYEIQGIRADLLNIQWIYRGKKFYNLSPEVLLNYTISFGGRLKEADIKELCYIPDLKELETRLLDSKYGFLFDHDSTKDIFMDRRICRYLYYRLFAYKRNNTLDMVQTLVYLILLEFEVRDMISILENVRYEIEDPTERKYYLIRKIE